MKICNCGQPAMPCACECFLCWITRHGWNEEIADYPDEELPFDGPVHDTDYAGEREYITGAQKI